ncbi:PREDICTED: uncharacterized protein LOC108756541 [Trachymyrmex septentrionalis]|uniref:uncharacterized protein LOC108756541 n=1 Tax=Trachymyrmex septentrionalis TaxID=34720 RepID=UPI00084EF7FA|nr:PREDICTED: uncharacterized protein LOC108756541 [Trachymyrmex septentrionalis]
MQSSFIMKNDFALIVGHGWSFFHQLVIQLKLMLIAINCNDFIWKQELIIQHTPLIPSNAEQGTFFVSHVKITVSEVFKPNSTCSSDGVSSPYTLNNKQCASAAVFLFLSNNIRGKKRATSPSETHQR